MSRTGKKCREPGGELFGGQNVSHQRCLDEGRREKFILRGFEAAIIVIVAIPAAGRLCTEGVKIPVAGRAGVSACKDESKGAVGMDSGPHRIGAKWQIGLEAVHEFRGQRPEGRCPCAPFRSAVAREFSGQHERPGPAIRSLETARAWLAQIGAFALDVFRGELAVKQRTDRCRLGQCRKTAIETGEQPVAMNTGMPVETAKKDGMELPRRADIVRSIENVVKLVGIFAADMAERD